jgi:hypothetical protein
MQPSGMEKRNQAARKKSVIIGLFLSFHQFVLATTHNDRITGTTFQQVGRVVFDTITLFFPVKRVPVIFVFYLETKILRENNGTVDFFHWHISPTVSGLFDWWYRVRFQRKTLHLSLLYRLLDHSLCFYSWPSEFYGVGTVSGIIGMDVRSL